MFQRVMHGPVNNDRVAGFKDLSIRELAVVVPIVVLMFWIGFFPGTILRKMDATVTRYVSLIKSRENIFVKADRPAAAPNRVGSKNAANAKGHR
jgi:NADH-quinone oxidoreductase subunit M